MSAIFKQNASISVPSSEVPVGGSYDVVVCGGGPAGLIAAVAAARNGARTLLIERYGFVGGMSTSALVTPISEFRHFGKQHIGGIPFELLQKAAELGGPNVTPARRSLPVNAQLLPLDRKTAVYGKRGQAAIE